MGPINGHDVFRAFKGTSLTSHSVVVFLSDHSPKETNNHSFGLNEKNVIVKPDHPDDFIKSIESYLQDGGSDREEMSHDFNTLFQLSPYGVFLYAGDRVLKANSFLLAMIDRELDFTYLKLDDIFERSSFLKVRQWIKHYTKDNNSVFNDSIIVKDRIGGEYPMNLKLSEFKASGENVKFVGFVSPSMSDKNGIVNYQLANEVCNMLKRESLPITPSLEKKITQIIKLRTVDNNNENKAFFTKRENEVLRLTMEGLSIKVIADKLSISSRTVEKYRTKLMEKSGAKNIVEVIVFSLKNNLVKI